jgi:hypothetical protein
VELVCKKEIKIFVNLQGFSSHGGKLLRKENQMHSKGYNGDEFFFKSFKGYYKAKHIQQQFTASYSL